MDHDWITTRALPGRSYDSCARKGCEARAMRWFKDGQWRKRQTRGPVECTK